MITNQRQRGFTLIELLVVVAIIGILASILIPNIIGAMQDAKKTADAENLKGLMKAFIDGQSNKRAVPKATGYKFWLALYVGDEGADKEGGSGLYRDDAYLTPGDAGYLVSPADEVNDKSRTEQMIEDAVISGRIGELDSRNCSYAGPRQRVMLRSSKLGGRIIGVTGSRKGNGFFDDGFNAVKGNLESTFYEYVVLAKRWTSGNWSEDNYEPDWDDIHLKYVDKLPNDR